MLFLPSEKSSIPVGREGIQVGVCPHYLVTVKDALERQNDVQPVNKKGQFLFIVS